jgi:hypothetical protein
MCRASSGWIKEEGEKSAQHVRAFGLSIKIYTARGIEWKEGERREVHSARAPSDFQPRIEDGLRVGEGEKREKDKRSACTDAPSGFRLKYVPRGQIRGGKRREEGGKRERRGREGREEGGKGEKAREAPERKTGTTRQTVPV